MPTIKRWSPQVEQAPLPSVQIQPMNWGGAAAVSRSMSTVTEIVSRQENKAYEDEARSILAGGTAALGSARLELEAEVEKAKGDGALKQDLLGDYSVKFQERAAAIRESLPPSLHAQFDVDLAGQKLGLERSVRGHIAKEAEAFSEVQHKAELSNATNIAVKSALATVQEGRAVTSNPDLLEQRRRVEKEADRIVTRNGWTGEAADAAKRLQMSQYHLEVASALASSEMAGAPEAAKAYLAKYSNEVDAALLDKSKIQTTIETAGLVQRSKVEEEKIWKQAGGNAVRAGELIRAHPDARLSDAMDARLNKRVAEQNERRKVVEKPVIESLENGWLTGGGFNPATSVPFSKLSIEGQNSVLTKWNTYQRSMKAEGTADRQQQARDDDAALWHYRGGIPYSGKQGEDRLTIDVDDSSDPVIAGASKPMRDRIKYEQAELRAKHAKDQGVPLTLVQKEGAKLGKSLGWSDGKIKQFNAYVAGSYAEWSGQDENKGKQMPNAADVYKILKSALDYGDNPGILGHGFAGNAYRFENPKITTTDFAEQPGHKALDENYKPSGELPPIGRPKAAPGAPAPAAAPAAPAMQIEGVPDGEVARIQALWAKDPRNKLKRPLTPEQVKAKLEWEKTQGAK